MSQKEKLRILIEPVLSNGARAAMPLLDAFKLNELMFNPRTHAICKVPL